MWQYNCTEELYHYGVPGMKWGVHRQRRIEARNAYKKRVNEAYDEYDRTINDIERPYKRGQNLSRKDLARESAAEKKYSDELTKAKADYKKTKATIRNEKLQAKGKAKVDEIFKKIGKDMKPAYKEQPWSEKPSTNRPWSEKPSTNRPWSEKPTVYRNRGL